MRTFTMNFAIPDDVEDDEIIDFVAEILRTTADDMMDGNPDNIGSVFDDNDDEIGTYTVTEDE